MFRGKQAKLLILGTSARYRRGEGERKVDE
jgi:hypothetical protein